MRGRPCSSARPTIRRCSGRSALMVRWRTPPRPASGISGQRNGANPTRSESWKRWRSRADFDAARPTRPSTAPEPPDHVSQADAWLWPIRPVWGSAQLRDHELGEGLDAWRAVTAGHRHDMDRKRLAQMDVLQQRNERALPERARDDEVCQSRNAEPCDRSVEQQVGIV